MIQSGILYTVNSVGIATNVPIKNARILFKQGNAIRAQTTTNAITGAYSADVPLGKYTVELAAGSTTSIVRAGQEFELTSLGNASTFQNWLYSKSGDINDALLKSFKDIADAISRDKTATESAKNEIVNNSVGNSNGKFMREGAGGWINTTSETIEINLNNIIDTSYKIIGSSAYINIENGYPANTAMGAVSTISSVNWRFQTYISEGNTSRFFHRFKRWDRPGYGEWIEHYTDRNTTVDSNGFIKRASPIIKISAKGFEHSGFSEDPICEKIGVGVYKITNTLGLADGIEDTDWYIELPRDRYGDPYYNVDLTRTRDGVIARVFERKVLQFRVDDMDFGEDRDGNPIVAYEKVIINTKATDIKENWRFFSLRFKEPETEEI